MFKYLKKVVVHLDFIHKSLFKVAKTLIFVEITNCNIGTLRGQYSFKVLSSIIRYVLLSFCQRRGGKSNQIKKWKVALNGSTATEASIWKELSTSVRCSMRPLQCCQLFFCNLGRILKTLTFFDKGIQNSSFQSSKLARLKIWAIMEC